MNSLFVSQVESLAASRQSSSGSEPADSVRAVNALLTQLDNLKGHTNVMVIICKTLQPAYQDSA